MIKTILPGPIEGVPILEDHFSESITLPLEIVANKHVPVGPDELSEAVQHVVRHLARVPVMLGSLQTKSGGCLI